MHGFRPQKNTILIELYNLNGYKATELMNFQTSGGQKVALTDC